MRFHVIFKQKNPDYDREYANQYNDGKESINNLKNLFSKAYELTVDVKEYSITPKGKFNLKGTLTSGEMINEFIPNMHVLICYRKRYS